MITFFFIKHTALIDSVLFFLLFVIWFLFRPVFSLFFIPLEQKVFYLDFIVSVLDQYLRANSSVTWYWTKTSLVSFIFSLNQDSSVWSVTNKKKKISLLDGLGFGLCGLSWTWSRLEQLTQDHPLVLVYAWTQIPAAPINWLIFCKVDFEGVYIVFILCCKLLISLCSVLLKPTPVDPKPGLNHWLNLD